MGSMTAQCMPHRAAPPSPAPPKEPIPFVQDPAMREVLKARRRALLAEVAAIEKHLGPEPARPRTG